MGFGTCEIIPTLVKFSEALELLRVSRLGVWAFFKWEARRSRLSRERKDGSDAPSQHQQTRSLLSSSLSLPLDKEIEREKKGLETPTGDVGAQEQDQNLFSAA